MAADIDVLSHQIVWDDHEIVTPDVLLQRGSSWVPLREHPVAPWLDSLAGRAIEAVQAHDIEVCETISDRLLRFGNDRDSEAVWIAKLLLGHIRFVSGELPEAIAYWESAAKSRSRVQAVAYSNLGVAWALSRQPLPAIQCLDMAIASSRNFLLAHISRRNLAETLVREEAPSLPGRPTWIAIQKDASEHVNAINSADTCRLLRPDFSFPTYHVMHVFMPTRG